MRRSIENLNRIIAIALIMAIVSSCTMDLGGPKAMSERLLISRSARLMEVYIDEVAAAISDDELPGFREAWQRGFSSEDVARGTLSEEGGREYLEFTLETSRFDNADDVFKAAEGLVPEEELESIKETVKKAETRLFKAVERKASVLTPSQMEEFYDDLTVLVIKSAVLLTAAVVYSLVPSAVLWGKVTAASAVAVASGVLAATIMAIVEHYKSDMDIDETFVEWLEDVAKEPLVHWGIASSIISLSQSINKGPVVASVILVVFALFGVADDAKEMLEKYNFNA